MLRLGIRFVLAASVLASVALTVVVAGAGSPLMSVDAQRSARPAPLPMQPGSTPINHVVIIMMENQTYDSLFGRFPGGNGLIEPRASNPLPLDPNHTGPAALAAIHGGQMDGFLRVGMAQYTQEDIPIYWTYATQFTLGDNFFHSLPTSSTPNHLVLLTAQAGGLFTTPRDGLCESQRNNLGLHRGAALGNEYWAYPCYNMLSLPQLLEARGISWRYYTDFTIWDAPNLLMPILNSPNNILNANQFLQDVLNGQMAQVSWVTPPEGATDHPPLPMQPGQNFVSSVVNAIMNSPYWPDTAIFLTWDDYGGWYDHVPPPQIDANGMGLREPLIVISPYAKQGYISHQWGEFASFAKFIEDNWSLPRMGRRDSINALSNLQDHFDFSQSPRPPLTLTPLPTSDVLQVPNGLGVRRKGGVPGAIYPTYGDPTTVFTYSILYVGTTSPAIHNVIIDGAAHPMVNMGPMAPGTWYVYSTTLPLGSHRYTYVFSDGSGTTTLPFNHAFAGPELYPFSIRDIEVPEFAMPGTPITYSVTYASPSNTAPTIAFVDIDGNPFPLTPHGSDYAAGVLYTYTTSSLSVGQHYFRLRFDDGTGTLIHEGGPIPSVSPITLSQSSVSPQSGTTATLFTFQTTYTNAYNQAPLKALLYVDDVPIPLTYVSGAYNTGALYRVTRTLPAGNHYFYFVFSDSTTAWGDPFSPGEYAGPSVGPGAEPFPPGMIVDRSRED